MIELLKEMNAELEQLKAKHLEKSKAMFTNIAKSIFDKHDVLLSFGWTQYTPYFNDGDECVFSANIDYPYINGINVDDNHALHETTYEKVDGKYQSIPNKAYDPALGAALKDVEELLSNIDESALRDLFGDHVKITVTREGTKVENYRHD